MCITPQETLPEGPHYGADVNCLNENTFRALFPEVKLSVFPHEIQNFGNSTADISVLGHFQAYLLFKGEKHENTFIVTDANDCPNLLSHDAAFWMGVLKPNYPRSMLVDGEQVPHCGKMSNSNRNKAHLVQLNVFQILKDLQMEQSMVNYFYKSKKPVQSISFRTTTFAKRDEKPDLTTSACNQGNQENSALVGIQVFPVKAAAPSVSRTPTEMSGKPTDWP